MNTREVIDAMPVEKLRKATAELVAAMDTAHFEHNNKYDRNIELALKAFEPSPSPLDKAREALRKAGFERLQVADDRDPRLVILIHMCQNELWRLP